MVALRWVVQKNKLNKKIQRLKEKDKMVHEPGKYQQ